MTMTDSERLELITGAAQEVVGVEHLEARIGEGGVIRAYVGFEPSGKAHVGWKVLATNLRRMLDADVNVLIFLADWHAWVNDKFGGDMDKIQTTG
ncbi:MAG TPA: tyrosine--tRNA ligase, partial [Candidatus Poseidoniales archaeon]